MKQNIIILKNNVIFYSYLLVLFLFLNLIYADSISQSTKNLSIKLETTDQNIIIVNSQNKNYIKLINNQQITITCIKDVSLGNGSLTAFVNTKIAQPSYCLKYIENSDQNDDNNCLQEEFTFNLESDRSNYFEVWCKFVSLSQNKIASLFLQRLYEDSIPRIRNGLSLTSANATVTHFINLEKISCEAIRKDTDKTFDSIDWFLTDTQQSLSSDSYQLKEINDSILNFTKIFPATSGLVKNNTYYRCCTLLNNTIKNCQQFLAVKHTNPSENLESDLMTTRKTLHLSKKIQQQPIIPMNLSKTNDEKVAKAANLISSTTSFRILKETGNEIEVNMENSLRTATVCCDTIGSSGSGGGSSTLGNSEVGIIIACIGGAVILILIFILIFLCYKRRRFGSIYTQNRCISGSDKSSVIRISQDHLNQSHHDLNSNHYDHYHHHHHCDHHCHHHPDHHLHHHNHQHHQYQSHYHHAHHPDEICNNSTIQSHTASFRNLDQSYERALNESRVRELNETHFKDYISIIPVTHETTKYYSSTTKTTQPNNDDDSKLYQKVKKPQTKKKSSFFKRSNKKSLNITQIDITSQPNNPKSSNITKTTSSSKHSNSIKSNKSNHTIKLTSNINTFPETLPPPPPPPPIVSHYVASPNTSTVHLPITSTGSTSYVSESKKSNLSDNKASESSILYAAQPKRTSIKNNANKDITMLNEMIETYEEEVEHEEKINHNNVLY